MRPWAALPNSIHATASAAWRRHVGVPGRNRLRNGGFHVNQRNPGAAYTSASVFPNGAKAPILDFWLAQGDGADRCDVLQELTTVPTGSYAACRLDGETLTASPNAEKFGIAQFIESYDCIDLRGGKCSAQVKLRTGFSAAGANISNARAAIIEWTGAVDTPTATLAAAAAWGAEGANPTLAAGWAYISTPANLALTTSYQTFLIEGVSVGATANNLGLFIWVDDKDTVADSYLYIADAKLEEGPYCTRFEQPDFTNELMAAGRRFRKTFPYATVPAQNAGVGGALRTVCPFFGTVLWNWDFSFPTRAAGTLVTFNPSAANASGRDITGSQDLAVGTTTVSERHLSIQSASGNATEGEYCLIHATIDSEFQA